MITSIGSFAELNATIVRVGKGYSSGLIGGDGHFLDLGIKLPVRILGRDLLCVQSSGLQIGDSDAAVCSGSEGGTFNRLGAICIIIQAHLPACQVFPGVGFLHQLHIASFQNVMEADGCRLTSGEDDLLGIFTGTGVQCIDGTVLVAKLLDIHSTRRKSCNRNLTVGISGMGTGNQRGASRIGVDTELPAGQILIVLSGLGQVQSGRIQLIYKADGSSLTGSECNLLRIGTVAGVQGVDGAVRMTQLFDVHGTSGKISYGDLTIGFGSMGAGNQGGAGRIRVDAKLPARQVFAVLSCLSQIQSGGVQLVDEADGRSLSDGECDFLRIGAIARVHSVNGIVCMSQLLNVHGACGKTSYGNLAICIGGVGSGDASSTSGIRVDAELPAG